jgi:hypothetical protein
VTNLSTSTKWAIYVALNVMLALALVIGSGFGGGSLVELPYVLVLFAICSSPLPFVERLNGPFMILSAAMAVYFMEFGALDAMMMLQPPAKDALATQTISRTETTLWLGAVMQVLGFHGLVRLLTGRRRGFTTSDWSRKILLPVGLLLWVAAMGALLYHNLIVQVDNTSMAIQGGFTQLGIWGATGLILMENYAGPLGIMIVAYWWAVWGKRAGTPLVLALIFAQFVVGWIVDTKEVAVSAPVVVLLTRFIVLGKVPMRWWVTAVISLALVFPILSAKRVVMTEEMQITRAQALPRTLEILIRTLQERDALRNGKYEQRTQTFVERESVKGSVQLIVDGTAAGHAYKLGSTFEPLLYAFFPRVFWSDKPAENSALLLNREFHISADPDTFISPSHVGEWYWNFGLPGVIVGMFLTGALLGYIGVRFDPSSGTSVTRVLVIMVTLYLLVARSEGQVEIQYVLWARSMLLIGLLHLMLAQRSAKRRASAPTGSTASPPMPPEIAQVRFPNLLR